MIIRAETEFETFIKNLDSKELGDLVKEYIAESNHMEWDGFERHDMTGIRKFLADVKTYHENKVVKV
jgi:hypothetical protein